MVWVVLVLCYERSAMLFPVLSMSGVLLIIHPYCVVMVLPAWCCVVLVLRDWCYG